MREVLVIDRRAAAEDLIFLASLTGAAVVSGCRIARVSDSGAPSVQAA